jgi:pimeloyl-ACP methyl ester carboxylesterase
MIVAPRGRRTRGHGEGSVRTIGVVLLAVVLVLLAAVGAGGWHFADEIRDQALVAAPPGAPEYRIRVLAAGAGTVALARDATTPRELTLPGVWGLAWPGGYGQAGAIAELGPDRVVRAFTALRGAPPRPGERVALDGFAFPGDPSSGLGLRFQEVRYASDVGAVPAWYVAGTRRTWVLFVHGYNAERREALRLLRPVAAAGWPALVLAYRNDPGAPAGAPGRDRLRRWGQSEWRDLEGAVSYALAHGATGVVLVGYSMGGAIVAAFLERSRLAGRVRGAVLDAPVLRLAALIDHGARDRTLPLVELPIPPPLVWAAERIAQARFGVDWAALDYLGRADRLHTPILLFQGTADDRVPVALADRLASARPDLITYQRVEGAGHVESWNLDPARYERAALAFLERVAQPDDG